MKSEIEAWKNQYGVRFHCMDVCCEAGGHTICESEALAKLEQLTKQAQGKGFKDGVDFAQGKLLHKPNLRENQ